MPSLEWQLLSTGPPILQPRARHAALVLGALQPRVVPLNQDLARTAGAAAAGLHGLNAGPPISPSACPPDLLGCLVVFGGVGLVDEWLTDVTLVGVTDSGNGCCSVTLLPGLGTGRQQGSAEAAGMLQACDGSGSNGGSTAASIMPSPLRDFAACECGPTAFIVTGGFSSSSSEVMQLQMCTLRQQPLLPEQQQQQLPNLAAAAEPGRSAPAAATITTATSASSISNSQWLRGWAAQWSTLQPRNRSPPGRCHHSACWHAGSSSVVVFGGWASRQGCLGDVQVYQVQHNEWWQPGDAGG